MSPLEQAAGTLGALGVTMYYKALSTSGTATIPSTWHSADWHSATWDIDPPTGESVSMSVQLVDDTDGNVHEVSPVFPTEMEKVTPDLMVVNGEWTQLVESLIKWISYNTPKFSGMVTARLKADERWFSFSIEPPYHGATLIRFRWIEEDGGGSLRELRELPPEARSAFVESIDDLIETLVQTHHEQVQSGLLANSLLKDKIQQLTIGKPVSK